MSTSAATDPATPSSVGAGSAAATPLAASTPAPPRAAPAAPRATWGDVLMWRDPIGSLFLFASGLGAYYAAGWVLSGGAPVSPASAAAYLGLAHLGLNFLRFFCSARWHAAAMWEGSGWADAAAEAAVRGVRRAAALHDAYLSSKDPHVTLVVALSLWALAWLGSALSARQLLLGGYVAAFTLPALYGAHRAAADAALGGAYRATLGRIDAAEMPRTARLLALSAALAALLVLTTWAQFAIGGLVAATYWRTTLAPADVAAIRAAAEPLTHDVSASVRKVRARLSSALDDARARYSTGGPRTRTAPRTAKAHMG
ncbi:MAG: hypothetical protein J3K34DRAFT_410680 [Monoraphidium minutum]|nr:MAG: hypothetical protein J3K34DRAFT_410680 [Monoraphidium minutum]